MPSGSTSDRDAENNESVVDQYKKVKRDLYYAWTQEMQRERRAAEGAQELERRTAGPTQIPGDESRTAMSGSNHTSSGGSRHGDGHRPIQAEGRRSLSPNGVRAPYTVPPPNYRTRDPPVPQSTGLASGASINHPARHAGGHVTSNHGSRGSARRPFDHARDDRDREVRREGAADTEARQQARRDGSGDTPRRG